MSKNAPKAPGGKGQQPSWWILALWSVSFFLLLRSCNNQPSVAQQKSLEDNMSFLRSLSTTGIHEGTSNTVLGTIQSQIKDAANKRDDLLKHGKISQADASAEKKANDQILVEATMLTADADKRAGEFLQAQGDGRAFDKYQFGYQLLYTLQQQFQDTPLWKAKVQLGPDDKGLPQSISPADLYDKTLTELSAESSHNPVYGLIPGFKIIDSLVAVTGRVPSFSYWFAALLMAAVVRAIIWPLTQRQLMFGRQMSQLAPMLREIKAQYPDAAVAQRKTMELYSEYGINPLAGCWPAFIQMPLFLGIYQCMLRYRFEFQKGTFLWINEQISHNTHAFTAPNLGQKDVPLIIIYAVTLLVSTLLTPVSDPTQVRQQRTVGVAVALIFPFFMLMGTYPVSAAFVLYWTFTNLFATMQSLRAYYLLPAPPLVKVNTATGGVVPTARKQGWWDKMQDQMRTQFEEKQRQMEEEARKLKERGEDSSGGSAANQPKPKPSDPPAGGKQKPKKRNQ